MKTGAIIVPSCGLDSIPSDFSAFLGNKTLKSHGAYPQHPVLGYQKYHLYQANLTLGCRLLHINYGAVFQAGH